MAADSELPEPTDSPPADPNGPGPDATEALLVGSREGSPGRSAVAVEGESWSPDDSLFPSLDVDRENEASQILASGVPAVVAVVVTRNPGPWLEATLESIGQQEYASLSTLVIDAGSVVDPTDRVAAVLPSAFVKLTNQSSFARAGNLALGAVEGAAFYLFCHEDCRLGPSVVQAMVEEAFRSNAGVVGAKLVDWDDPERILSVGATIDRFGFSRQLAEVGELDQGQHDAVRDVLFISTAAMLIRCDLFADLGGFSSDLEGSADGLDICWRARIAGARTVVMPAAAVQHRERAEIGEASARDDGHMLKAQIRVLLACYSASSLLKVLPQAVALSMLEMLYFLLRGRVKAARNIASALVWNLGHLPSTLKSRSAAQGLRRTPDEEIRALQLRGSTRVAGFLRRAAHVERPGIPAALLAAASTLPARSSEFDFTERPSDLEAPPDRSEGFTDGWWAIAATLFAAFVVVVGLRTFITKGTPVLREFMAFESPSNLLAQWWLGWSPTSFGSTAGAPTITGIVGLLGFLSFGHAGLLRTLLLIGPIPLGLLGAWRLLRGAAPSRTRAAVMLAYLANPLPYNSLAEGRWQALVLYAAAPFLLRRLGQAGNWAPFDKIEPPAGSLQRQIVGCGLTIFAAFSVAPQVLVLVTLLTVVLVLLFGREDTKSAHRLIKVSAGGVMVAVALHLPWIVAMFRNKVFLPTLFGTDPSRVGSLNLREVLHFDSGPYGGWLTVGLVVVVGAALVVSEAERFRWSVYGATLVVFSAATVVLAGGVSTIGLPVAEVLLVPAALGVALAAGMAAQAFSVDLPGSSFGLRQIAAVAGIAGFALALLPVPFGATSGRWSAVLGDVRTALSPVEPKSPVNERTLWIGDPQALPFRGVPLGNGLSFGVTPGVVPRLGSLFPGPADAGLDDARDAVRIASELGTSRLGRALAPLGIRYVVIAERAAPLPYGRTYFPVDPVLIERFEQQLDLAELPVVPGLRVFENLNLARNSVLVPSEEAASIATTKVTDRLDEVGLSVADPTFTAESPTRLSGSIGDGQSLVLTTQRTARWEVTVNGTVVEPQPAFKWAAQYRAPGAGELGIRLKNSPWNWLLHTLQLAFLVTLPWMRRRRVAEGRSKRSVTTLGDLTSNDTSSTVTEPPRRDPGAGALGAVDDSTAVDDSGAGGELSEDADVSVNDESGVQP